MNKDLVKLICLVRKYLLLSRDLRHGELNIVFGGSEGSFIMEILPGLMCCCKNRLKGLIDWPFSSNCTT